MKRMNNNVHVISASTIVTVLLSAVAMTFLSVLLIASASFARNVDYDYDDEYDYDVEYNDDVEYGDQYNGPGIGMNDATWNGTITNRIYGYTLNGIIGDAVDEHNAFSSDGPTTYVEYTEDNPINHYLLDLGPKSASNAAYSLHFRDDGGPGMNIQSNELGSTKVFDDGGPGFMVSALNGTETTYVDNGPRTVESTADPSDFVKLMNMKPGDFTFVGGSKADKLGK